MRTATLIARYGRAQTRYTIQSAVHSWMRSRLTRGRTRERGGRVRSMAHVRADMVMIAPTMGLLESIRRLFGRAENAMNEADYAALDAVHHVEDRIDDATGGRFYDAVEKADEEADELLDRLHLDGESETDDRSER